MLQLQPKGCLQAGFLLPWETSVFSYGDSPIGQDPAIAGREIVSTDFDVHLVCKILAG